MVEAAAWCKARSTPEVVLLISTTDAAESEKFVVGVMTIAGMRTPFFEPITEINGRKQSVQAATR